MSKIILAAIGFWIIVTYPQVLVGAAVTIGILLYLGRDNVTFGGLIKSAGEKEEDKEDTVSPEDRKIYGKFIDEDGIIDWEGYHRAQVEEQMIPGYKDDPEWQKKSESIKKFMREKRVEAEREEQEEMNENEQTFWRKVR